MLPRRRSHRFGGLLFCAALLLSAAGTGAAPLRNGSFADGFLHWSAILDDGFAPVPVDPASDAAHFAIVGEAATVSIGDPFDASFLVTLAQAFDFPDAGQSVEIGFTLVDSDFGLDTLTIDNVVADPVGLTISFDLAWSLTSEFDFFQANLLVDGAPGPILLLGDASLFGSGAAFAPTGSVSVAVDVSSLAVATAEPGSAALLALAAAGMAGAGPRRRRGRGAATVSRRGRAGDTRNPARAGTRDVPGAGREELET